MTPNEIKKIIKYVTELAAGFTPTGGLKLNNVTDQETVRYLAEAVYYWSVYEKCRIEQHHKMIVVFVKLAENIVIKNTTYCDICKCIDSCNDTEICYWLANAILEWSFI